MPVSLPPPLLNFLCDLFYIRCLPYSLIILLSFVTPHIHRIAFLRPPIFLFLCFLQRPCLYPVHQYRSYHCSVGLHLPLGPSRSFSVTQHCTHSFFHPLSTRWVTSAASSPSSANVDPRYYLNVFTLFTVSSCKWVSKRKSLAASSRSFNRPLRRISTPA